MQHHCEVAPALVRWRLQKSVNVLEKDEPWQREFQEPHDLPPENAFLPLEPRGLREDSRYRIVLTWKAADQQIDLRKLGGSVFDVVKDRRDVVVVVGVRTEALDVTRGRVLPPASRLPLVAPDDSPRSVVLSGQPFKGESESADASEEFRDAALLWNRQKGLRPYQEATCAGARASRLLAGFYGLPVAAFVNFSIIELLATDPRNPNPSSVAVHAVMKANRGRDTSPERLFRQQLWRAGVRGYRTNLRIAGVRPDLVFTRHRLAVFVHGCFWHRCAACAFPLPRANRAFWAAKFRRNRQRDLQKRRQLEAEGWKVVEVWSHEVEALAGARRAVSAIVGVVRKVND